MKKLTRFFAACVVVVAISAATSAGELQTPGAPAAQPTPTPGQSPTPGTPSLDPSSPTLDAVLESVELMATWFLNSF